MPGSTRNRWLPTLSSNTSRNCPQHSTGSVSFHKPQIDAAPAQLGEIGGQVTEFTAEFHPHRDHYIAGDQAGEPEFSLVGRLIAAAIWRKTGNPVAPHPTELGRTGEARQG